MRHDAPHLFQILRHEIHKPLHAIKPQPFTLCVEIPIKVVRLGIRDGLHRALERFLDGLLMALLVDEVDEPDFIVDPSLLGQVESQGGYL